MAQTTPLTPTTAAANSNDFVGPCRIAIYTTDAAVTSNAQLPIEQKLPGGAFQPYIEDSKSQLILSMCDKNSHFIQGFGTFRAAKGVTVQAVGMCHDAA